MVAVLIGDKETPVPSTLSGHSLTARNIPAHAFAPWMDDRDPAPPSTLDHEALVTRSRLFFRALSRAMTGAYVITPPFGSTLPRAQWTDSEHRLPRIDSTAERPIDR